MTNPPVGPRFRLAPGTVLRGGRRPPLPPTADPGAGRADAADTTDAADTADAADTTDAAGTAGPAGADGIGATRFRNTLHDRAAIAVTVDPSWLLAPLYARAAARLAVAGAGLPGPLDEAVPAVPAVPVTADRLAAAADWPGWWAAALAYRPGTPAPRQDDLLAGSPALQGLWGELAGSFGAWLSAHDARGPGPDAGAVAVERAALGSFAARRGREPGRWTVRILQIPVTGAYLHSPETRRIVVSAALRGDPDAYAAALDAQLPDHF